MKTSRERDGLTGPVRMVGIHVEKLLANIERPASSGRTLEQLITYNTDGQRIEEITYGDDGTVQSRQVYIHDEARHSGRAIFDSAGSLLQRSVCIHNPDGKMTEELVYSSDGKLLERRVRRSDLHDKLQEQTTYTAEGKLEMKMLTVHDDEGRMVENRLYIPKRMAAGVEQSEPGRAHHADDGFLENRLVVTYRQNIIEMALHSAGLLINKTVIVENAEQHTRDVTSYNELGVLQSRETIEQLNFDDHGNWTEERVSSWVAGASKTESTEVEPTELHHRIITYY